MFPLEEEGNSSAALEEHHELGRPCISWESERRQIRELNKLAWVLCARYWLATLAMSGRKNSFLSLSCSVNHLREGWNSLWRNLSYLLLQMEQINLKKILCLGCKHWNKCLQKEMAKQGYCNQTCACCLPGLESLYRSQQPCLEKEPRSCYSFRKSRENKEQGKSHTELLFGCCIWLGWVCLGNRKVTV